MEKMNNKNESVVIPSVEDETLAQTDEVIPAPETADSDVDVIPEDPAPVVTVDGDVPPVESVPAEEPAPVDPAVDTPAEAPVVENPVDTPVDVPVDVPPVQVENPAGDVAEPEIVNPVVDAPAEPVEAPVEAPVEVPGTSDVVPGVGDETPVDGACAENPGCQGSITLGQFFGTIQECVSIAWRFHLKTRVYRVHNALNEFYEKALDVVDDIIEQYQGICGVVEEPFVNCIIGEGKTEGEYLTELKAFVENNKCIIGDHSEIMSVIDDFLGLIDSTNYKLTSFSEHAVKSFDEFVYEDYQVNEGCHCDDEDTQEEEEEE